MILRTAQDCDRFALAMKAKVRDRGPHEVVDKPWKPRRSSQQNRYLHGVVYAAFLNVLPGWSRDDVHEYLLGEWSGWETIEGMGRRRMKPLRRSSRLNKTEFAEYVAFCQQKGSEHGIYIPDPES